MIAQMNYISTVTTTPRYTGIKRPHPGSLVSSWSNENGNDDSTEVISLDEDEAEEEYLENEEEEVEDDDDEPEPNFRKQTFPASMVYFSGEQLKNHKYITITKATPEEEDEEVDIEEEADSDVEEIGPIENETIEILDDDDEDNDNVVRPDKEQNSTEAVPKISNGGMEVEEENEKHNKSSDSTSNKQAKEKTPEKVTDTDDCIILTPNVPTAPKITLKPIQDLMKPIQRPVEKNSSPQFHKSVVIGGVVKKVLTANDLKTGVIPMKSILNKGIIRGVKVVKNNVSLLKPISIVGKDKREQHSLLKPVTTEPKSLLKPEFNKDSREPQSILKSVKNRGDLKVNHQIVRTVVRPPWLNKSSMCCSECGAVFLYEKDLQEHMKCEHSIGDKSLRNSISKPPSLRTSVKCSNCRAIFLNEKDLREHMKSHHPSGSKDSPSYSPAAILELERELKDQSPHCRKCLGGLSYLPTLRSHAQVHPTGLKGCDACEHGISIIKWFIAHLEAHVDFIDSD